MTPEEALRIVDKNIASERPFWQTVRAALAKQVAEEHETFAPFGIKLGIMQKICPSCGSSGIIDEEYGTKFEYCPDCGQRILWEDAK